MITTIKRIMLAARSIYRCRRGRHDWTEGMPTQNGMVSTCRACGKIMVSVEWWWRPGDWASPLPDGWTQADARYTEATLPLQCQAQANQLIKMLELSQKATARRNAV